MWLVPYSRMTLLSSLGVDEVTTRLRELARENFRVQVAGRRFKLFRDWDGTDASRARKIFRAVFEGRVMPVTDGAILDMRVRLPAWVAVFSGLLLAWSVYFIGSILWLGWQEGFGPRYRNGKALPAIG